MNGNPKDDPPDLPLTAEQWVAFPRSGRAEMIAGIDDLTDAVVAWLEADGVVIEETADRVFRVRRRSQA
jgi:hypothetical protein